MKPAQINLIMHIFQVLDLTLVELANFGHFRPLQKCSIFEAALKLNFKPSNHVQILDIHFKLD